MKIISKHLSKAFHIIYTESCLKICKLINYILKVAFACMCWKYNYCTLLKCRSNMSCKKLTLNEQTQYINAYYIWTLLFLQNIKSMTRENKTLLVNSNIKNCTSPGDMKALKNNKGCSDLTLIYLKYII